MQQKVTFCGNVWLKPTSLVQEISHHSSGLIIDLLLSRPGSSAEVPDHPQWTDAVISNIDQEHKPTFASLNAYTLKNSHSPEQIVVGKLLPFWEGTTVVDIWLALMDDMYDDPTDWALISGINNRVGSETMQ